MDEVTVYDVANAAAVSIATVSRVINSPGKVRAETRLRVLKTIDALGFVPRADAVERARKRGGSIGVLAPFFTFPSFVERLNGVISALADSFYELVIFNVDSAARRDAYLVNAAFSRRIDGLIVMSMPFDDAAGLRLGSRGIETVLVEFARPAFCGVLVDNEAGGRLAAEYLVSRGRRRCAFVGDSEVPSFSLRTSDARLAGFREGLAAAGFPLAESLVSLAPHALELAKAQAVSLLKRSDPPDAIFAASDTQAMGVLKAARSMGLRVPDDLAVMGFDDLPLADYLGLTTVRQPLVESGRIAAELLVSRLESRGRQVQNIELPLSVITRETA
ncbi:MAG TPA: LacI family DNA-binding transcriptional regulator [Rectinemataceae bacterium]|nr:LacI family DNA-binding transcriptional regulator [Rectinemataceae bacterium]